MPVVAQQQIAHDVQRKVGLDAARALVQRRRRRRR